MVPVHPRARVVYLVGLVALVLGLVGSATSSHSVFGWLVIVSLLVVATTQNMGSHKRLKHRIESEPASDAGVNEETRSG